MNRSLSRASATSRKSRANGDRNHRMSRGWILETAKNPFENEPKLSMYELGKRMIVVVTLFPLRVVIGSISLLLVWIFAFFASVGHPLQDIDGCYWHSEPMSSWQSLFVRPMLISIRCVLWCLGIWRIQVNDQRSGGCCITKDCPNILVVAPHSSILDMFVVMYLFPGSGFMGLLDGLGLPIQDRVSAACQGVFVNYKDPNCKNPAKEALAYRASPDTWAGPPLSVYPEGTITNGRQFIQFRAAAFAPGEPVLPVILRYPWQHYDTSWVGANRDALWAVRCMLQIANYCVVDILDVYEPSEDEIKNPIQYACNVRELMAEEVNLPTTEHGYDDAFFYLEALFEAHINTDFEVWEMKQVLNADMDQLHAWLAIFKKLDTKGEGFLKRDVLSHILHISDKTVANRIFNYFDTDGSGLIEYREFVQILAMLSGQCSKNGLAKLAFMIYDVGNRGAIPRAVIAEALAGYDDDEESSHHSGQELTVGKPQTNGLNGGEAHGNENNMDLMLQWMWADGHIGSKIIAEKNPFRWSKSVSVANAMMQLSRCSADDQHRPVRISHTSSSEMPAKLARLITEKIMLFESVEVALVHLRKLEETMFLIGACTVDFAADDEDLITFQQFSNILEEKPQLLEAIIGDLQNAARDLQPDMQQKRPLDLSLGIHEGLPTPPLITVPCTSAKVHLACDKEKPETWR